MIARHFRSIRFHEVTDGLSQTLVAGETLPKHCRWNSAFSPNFSTTSTNIPLNTMEKRRRESKQLVSHLRLQKQTSGGVNFVYGDASVTSSGRIWTFSCSTLLGTRAGGESVTVPTRAQVHFRVVAVHRHAEALLSSAFSSASC